LGLTITDPMETIPSPIMHTRPFLRTHTMVVPCHDVLGERSGALTEMHRRDGDDDDGVNDDGVGDSHDDDETMPTAVGRE